MELVYHIYASCTRSVLYTINFSVKIFNSGKYISGEFLHRLTVLLLRRLEWKVRAHGDR